MYLQDILPKMSKLYLGRIVDSFLKDVRMDTEEEMREVIIRNVDEFQNKERVKRNLNFNTEIRDITLLNEMILLSLMEQQGYLLSESDLINEVEKLESEIVEQSTDDDYIKTAICNDAERIYSAVLIEAWKKDDSLNTHEINILNVLRKELDLSKRDHYLLESRIGRFPQKNNKLHTTKQIEKSLRNLQSRGLILRFKEDTSYYIIPKEIARIVRYEMGGELRNEVYETLLNDLNVNQLKVILTSLNINISGKKSDMIERIIKHNILPSTALNAFGTKDLSDILKNLEGAKVSGTKGERVQNIIDYYENISTPISTDPTDSRSRLYDFYEELASRDYKALRVNKIIDKDLNVEKYFEEATRYLFEKKLGLELVDMKGSKHADGKLKYSSKEVILWDNKSTEKPYTFPESHFDQFIGYIRSDETRVTTFLVVVQDYTKEAVAQAQKLKAFSEQDTDVALIKASDLKYVAEEWKSYSDQKNPKFNLQVFNLTGELSRNLLMSRMAWAI
ncbi:SAP domain-containing protein [Virgibacillus salinus]|uniref:SAP domain-containing protein n=1 Tax=Virgibacillus salinus TaxID=553311 RepID=A0A1H1EXM0_9BACI|nr:SAP domain-containing protein [Virgibacillus salinus]SDQ93274.1 SAP domain-containing protein [Virgibacillus salinus]